MKLKNFPLSDDIVDQYPALGGKEWSAEQISEALMQTLVTTALEIGHALAEESPHIVMNVDDENGDFKQPFMNDLLANLFFGCANLGKAVKLLARMRGELVDALTDGRDESCPIDFAQENGCIKVYIKRNPDIWSVM